jgi:hypothetical protein
MIGNSVAVHRRSRESGEHGSVQTDTSSQAIAVLETVLICMVYVLYMHMQTGLFLFWIVHPAETVHQ